MSPVRAVIFDLGNVLVDVDAGLAADKVAGLTGKTREDIYRFFFESQLSADFEVGRVSPEELYRQVKSFFGLAIGYDDFVRIWNEIFFVSQDNRRVLAVAARLSGEYRLAMLTNTNSLHYDYLAKTMPQLFTPFDHVITSFEAGARKPDPAIYRLALARLGAAAEETFYTDDRTVLVAAACGLGIRGAVFCGFEKLRSDLAGQGIEITDG